MRHSDAPSSYVTPCHQVLHNDVQKLQQQQFATARQLHTQGSSLARMGAKLDKLLELQGVTPEEVYTPPVSEAATSPSFARRSERVKAIGCTGISDAATAAYRRGSSQDLLPMPMQDGMSAGLGMDAAMGLQMGSRKSTRQVLDS